VHGFKIAEDAECLVTVNWCKPNAKKFAVQQDRFAAIAFGAENVADLHIVITEGGLILVRGATATFRDFQDTYPDFMTSLGPMDRDGVFEMFEIEWPDVLVMNQDKIRSFVDAQGAQQPSDVRLVMGGDSKAGA